MQPDKLSIQQILRAVKQAGGQYDARLVISARARPPAEALDKFRARAAKLGARAVSEPDADHRLLVTFDRKKETRLDDILKAAFECGVD
ncbi:MAG: hypothetical protein H0W86_10210 [Armatimonadetes bacterium]|nr:hypothetical protein [Armatimonadota bacterium]